MMSTEVFLRGPRKAVRKRDQVGTEKANYGYSREVQYQTQGVTLSSHIDGGVAY